MSRRRPSELSRRRWLLCVGLWLCEGTGPRRLRLGWAVRVSYQARLWSCRPGWGASCRPLRRKHRSIGSLPKVLQVEQEAIKSMPGRGGTLTLPCHFRELCLNQVRQTYLFTRRSLQMMTTEANLPPLPWMPGVVWRSPAPEETSEDD